MKNNVYPHEGMLKKVTREKRMLIHDIENGRIYVSVTGFGPTGFEPGESAIVWWEEEWQGDLPSRKPDVVIKENIPYRRHAEYWNL